MGTLVLGQFAFGFLLDDGVACNSGVDGIECDGLGFNFLEANEYRQSDEQQQAAQHGGSFVAEQFHDAVKLGFVLEVDDDAAVAFDVAFHLDLGVERL